MAFVSKDNVLLKVKLLFSNHVIRLSFQCEAGSTFGGVDDVTVSATISPSNSQYAANRTYMDITKGILHNYLSLANQQFFDYFNPGSFNYTAVPDYDPFKNSDGFIVTWD